MNSNVRFDVRREETGRFLIIVRSIGYVYVIHTRRTLKKQRLLLDGFLVESRRAGRREV
jgi:hypothetical protein